VIEAGNDLNFATINNLILQREAGEPVPAFRARARETALDLGAGMLIFAVLEPLLWVEDRVGVPAEDGEKFDENTAAAMTGDPC
jgi:hypothetical protein